ncbi:MAG: hypothetical protein NWQ45_10870, partial [Congregibacter sp.]|nr:hypothetical protein [Congregibacter sp.]
MQLSRAGLFWTLFLVVIPLTGASFSQGAASQNAEVEQKTEQTKTSIPPATEFVSEHSGTFNGRKLRYRARAGETYLRDDDGEPSAALFSFDYLAISDQKDRPVTFVWNGG